MNANGSVLWGSVSLTALCKNWSDTSKDGRDNGIAFGKSGATLQVDLYPSSLQVSTTFSVFTCLGCRAMLNPG